MTNTNKENTVIYTVDFAGNVKAEIEVKNNTITVTNAMDGYGNPIDVKNIKIIKDET